MGDPSAVEPCDPGVELVPSADTERNVVETGPAFVEVGITIGVVVPSQPENDSARMAQDPSMECLRVVREQWSEPEHVGVPLNRLVQVADVDGDVVKTRQACVTHISAPVPSDRDELYDSGLADGR